MFFKKKKSFDLSIEEAMQKDIRLVDVRSKEEFNQGYIKNSVNFPLDTIEQIDINKDKKLYVYCYSGSRSAMAIRKLKQMGYTDITNIGGIKDYTKQLQRR